MLDAFGLHQGGAQYRRLLASFQRIFGATMFFGTDRQLERAAVVHQARFNFMTEARIWYSRNPDEALLPGECQNMVLLSDEFYREILDHPIPTDLEAAKALLVLSGGAGPIHVAVVPLLQGQRKRADSAVWLLRSCQPARQRRIRASPKVS